MPPPGQISETIERDGRRDGDLLRQYAETRSEEAFTTLGRRYAGLIYATCLRETGDRTLAEDAAQGVLLLLSQKAGVLQRYETVAGWLYTASRYVARNLMKQERRRIMREADAALAAPLPETGSSLWERIEPHLHDALDRLKPADREAVLLRFVSEQSFTEVGQRLGVSENTARMRVSRALEKVRAHLGKIGIAVTVGALATLLEERAALAAPAGVLQSVSRIAAGSGIPGASGLLRLTVYQYSRQIALWKRLRLLAGISGAIVLLTGMVVYEQRLPHRLDEAERRRLYADLTGSWKGVIEYADDRTQQHFTYPTTVTFQMQDQGETLQFTASYAGSASVDVTTFTADPRTGQVTVKNGGPQSSHRLNGTGELARLRDGGFAFQGESVAMDADVRLLFALNSNRLTVQEEYRKTGQSAFQFRNRFTLSRQ